MKNNNSRFIYPVVFIIILLALGYLFLNRKVDDSFPLPSNETNYADSRDEPRNNYNDYSTVNDLKN